MESGMIVQEQSLENYKHHEEPKEIRNIGIKRESKGKGPGQAGLIVALTRETSEQALLGSMITNYIMHLR